MRRPRSKVRSAPSATSVALRATLIAIVVYVLACFVVDVLAIHHADETLDARLATRYQQLAKEKSFRDIAVPTLGSGAEHAENSQTGDIDAPPVFAWGIPSGTKRAIALVNGSPALSAGLATRLGYLDATIAGRPFRLLGRQTAAGKLIVASSLTSTNSLESIVLISELVVLPFIASAFFAVALVIGRRAAAPIERARQRQLEFAADASHELRTPLSVIEAEIGLALSANRSSDSYRRSLERVASESGRLKKIVDDLLWLARADAAPRAPASESVDLATALTECAARFEAVAARREIDLVVRVPDRDGGSIRAPTDWIDRLATAIVDNACRYTKAGGTVIVQVQASEESMALVVDDDGPGIPPEEREAILGRFHRVIRTPGGSGLGLSIADSVVRATGGSWEIGRSPAGGARVSVVWPRER